jgi:Flp pilus assembly secretin CpaC
MRDVCLHGRVGPCLVHWLVAAFLILNAAPALAAQPIVVQVDQTRLIELPKRAATTVIGDPLIADLSIQSGGLAVITGKSYGTTNVIVLDRDGERIIEVTGVGNPVVLVDRGDVRQPITARPNAPLYGLGCST